MRYIVIIQDPTGRKSSFSTDWFQAENHYIEGMIVIDRARNEITFDGVVWEEIEEDHL